MTDYLHTVVGSALRAISIGLPSAAGWRTVSNQRFSVIRPLKQRKAGITAN